MLLFTTFQILQIPLQDRLRFNDLELLNELFKHVIFSQVEALGKERLRVNVRHPPHILHIPAKTRLGSQLPVELEMVDHLPVDHILKIYVLLLADPFDIKAERFTVSVLTPSFFKEGFLHCGVPAQTDEHSLFGLNSGLFLPKSEVRYVFK